MINTRHLVIILALLGAGPMLRAQSSLIDTTGLAARIPFPPGAHIVDKPIEVRFSARLTGQGIVDSVVILDTAHHASPFGNAVRTILGTQARATSVRPPETVELIARFGKHVGVYRASSVSDTTRTLGAHANAMRTEYPTQQGQARGGPGILPPPTEYYPEPDEFVPVEREATCDIAELQRRVRYPEEARMKGVQGIVQIRCLLNSSGNIVNMLVERSDNPLLNDAALEAVRNTPFTPAIQKGKPVAMWVTIPIWFALK